ncbi:MAG: SsrA-binding protein SmpB [Deltaproteobacteria bacterium]|nr:SsrA-binding protein SmpB [Deltaproteobacteria bacterium]MBW1718086.1 SsrA-binding protein SmpB [Deltaproteobacteria bacterium]MBW1932201.1 SsrA-binding protein SmpB [Deltaproteobacteria bacterium]MBW1937520.1 SsrA-binding protein SmpB [Deltaproteobacteria bacterium]MBW1964607.1 SsrA-binding protein SmpB [Deltaproteobacteria bacterium]
MNTEGIKIVCQNRKARHQYHIENTVEAGLVLLGPEVKSLREARASLSDGYVGLRYGEAWLHNVHISPYPYAANSVKLDPTRARKLLLSRREIRKLTGKIQERGYTLIPLRIYFKNGKAKVELALAKGKKLYDKRETMRRKTLEREFQKDYKIR